ncbi:PTS system cellobiose-specific IIC component [Laceyella sacchari]|uniref:PTS sugar transporter subunit IIC n=1 Tax=Laceyella sacchari TaxID=37482 RepID=UPI001050BD32|nr:PTS sugar transporter subunit IIC [Laceyella sacchari]TCW34831.1 PTS system cellobiose-specific IIC component [Laceyella sacchari]
MHYFLQWIETRLMPPMARISEMRHIRAVRDGIIATLPLIIVGCFFIIIANPPVESWAKAVEPYKEQIVVPFRLTLGLMALYASFGMGHSLARSYQLDGVSGGLLTMATFIMATVPVNLDDKLPANQTLGWLLPLQHMGGAGLFMSIIAMLIAVETMRILKKRKWVIHMPESVPRSVARSFEALIPATVIVLFMWTIRVLLAIDLHALLQSLFQPLAIFAGNTFLGAMVPVLFIMLLWAAGIHGDAVVGSIFHPIWFALLDQNAAAAVAGKELPNLIVEPFFQWFVLIGGSGATLSLCVLMLFSKSSYLKQVGRFSIVPGIFNINEPIIFGVPMVMNPMMFIPFILAPLACTAVTYAAFSIGLIDKISLLVPWTLPGPIGAYLATGGSWQAVCLHLFNLILTGVIYWPFFKAYERKLLAEEQAQSA